jgi:hypothetical protein
MRNLTYRPLAQAASDIQTADLLLFRGKGFVSKAIRIAGRSAYSHAAKASWHNHRLLCLEVREFKGGRAVTLESQVAKYPKQIDVFQANAEGRWPEYDRAKADDYMTGLCGVEYGYFAIAESFVLHAPVLRWKAKPPTEDEIFDEKRLPYCSAAVAMADDFGGGVDVVPNLANWAVEPGDLARSLFYSYLFTLEP